IAPWGGDEGDPAKPSGAGGLAAFKVQGIAPAYYPWSDAAPLGFRGERGPVYVIHTPRTGAKPDDTALKKPAGQTAILLPAERKPFESLTARQPLAEAVSSLTRRSRRAAVAVKRQFGVSTEGKAELWQ